MKKVAYFSLSDDGSSYYRIGGVLPFIVAKGLTLHNISHNNPGSWSSMMGYDTLIMQRPSGERELGIVQQAQQMGIKVIIDLDDDILNVPEHNPAYGLYSGSNQRFIMQAIRMSDELWVSTDGIKNSCIRLNKNIHVIPNAHNDYLHKPSLKKPFNTDNKICFYRGGDTHRLDLFEYQYKIADVCAKNPDWKFIFMGADNNHEFLAVNKKNSNVWACNKLPTMQYFSYLYNLNPAMMICPLQDNILNHGKSNISLLEATYAGSGFVGQRFLNEFNHPFVLDMAHFDNFAEYKNPNRLKRYNEQAWDYIKENLFLSIVNQKRVERLLA